MAALQRKEGNASVPASPARAALVKHLADFAEAMLVDLPVAAARRLLRDGGELELNEAGWKAYDAALLITNGAAARILSSPAFGALAGRTFGMAIGLQRLNAATAGAVFATLWPGVGLPTAAEIDSMRDELRGMRDELRAARMEMGVRERLIEQQLAMQGGILTERVAWSEPRNASSRSVETPAPLAGSPAMSAMGLFRMPAFVGWPIPEPARERKRNVHN
jgi:hypothetical protein